MQVNIDVQKKQQNVDYNYNIKNILTRNRSNKFTKKKVTLLLIPYHFTIPPTSQNPIILPFYKNIIF